MKTILILLDSLNRHFLKQYNEKANTITPNIDEFAKLSVQFDNHFIGSAPCMPARRDILTGRLNFLERNWGPIEVFDKTFLHSFKENNILSHIITDHTHYAEIGGENYLQQFDTWDLIRGQEYDAYVSRCDKPKLPEKYYGKMSVQYELNKSTFFSENEYPTPKTFEKACEWAEDNKNSDNFFLMVEGFDPHEPFDCPQEYINLYEDKYEGTPYNWSSYDDVCEPPDAVEHLRNTYKATLTMTDKWLGKFIDSLKENNLFEDSMIILTTDHGHMLGEHNHIGKNVFQAYNEMSNIPLFIKMPKSKHKGEVRKSVTQNIDIMPTLLEYFNLEKVDDVRGFSLLDTIENDKKVRDYAIYGWFGSAINITNGKYTYFRKPNFDVPIYMYCSIPTTLWRYLTECKNAEIGKFLDRIDYPLYKIQVKNFMKRINENLLFDIENDYSQENPILNKEIEDAILLELGKQLEYHQAPKELHDRFEII